jgi:hypothetical protein
VKPPVPAARPPVPRRSAVEEEAITASLFVVHELWQRTRDVRETRRRLNEILALLGED